MTYLERLRLEYPDIAHKGAADKAIKCPSSWGYEQRIRGECRRMASCEACWNRKIPERRRA